jgi:hypothetical protein
MHKLTLNGTNHEYPKLTGTSLLNEFISLIQKISIENIEKYTDEIREYFSKKPELKIMSFLTNLKKDYLLPSMIDSSAQSKLDRLIAMLK